MIWVSIGHPLREAKVIQVGICLSVCMYEKTCARESACGCVYVTPRFDQLQEFAFAIGGQMGMSYLPLHKRAFSKKTAFQRNLKGCAPAADPLSHHGGCVSTLLSSCMQRTS